MYLDPHISAIIYEYLPVSEEDELMNTIFNIITGQKELSSSSPMLFNYCPNYRSTWTLLRFGAVRIALSIYCHPVYGQGVFRVTKLQVRRSGLEIKRVPEHLLDMPPTKLARHLAHLMSSLRTSYTGRSEIVYDVNWTVKERFQFSKEEFQLLFSSTASKRYGIDTFLRQPGFEVFNEPVFKQLLVKTIRTRRTVPHPSRWCDHGFFSKTFIKRHVLGMYQTFPLTLKSAETVLEAMGQKKITRTFKKKWIDQASSMDIHFCRKGSVGHGNGTVCFLTVEGFFDILHKRVRTTALRNTLFKLYQKVNQQIKIEAENELKSTEFENFGAELLKNI